MSTKYWQETRVVENVAVNTETFCMEIYAPFITNEAKPGQFVMLEINSLQDPLLNRPLGIAGVDKTKQTFTVFYRVVGKGTHLLTAKKPGASIKVVGPLGNGFDISAKSPLLIGGGMGLAPLLFVAQAMKNTEIITGGRTRSELFWIDLFTPVCQKVHVTTDDGSLGTKGTCISVIPQLFKHKKYDAILACGPKPMLRAVAEYAESSHIPCQVSLEKHMACGFGACLTCTCEKKDGGYFQVCKHGPVFKAEEVKL